MILKLFKQLTAIPRASGIYEPFVNFIKEYSAKYGYVCKIDNNHNVLCYKEGKQINLCLQAHYDIVSFQPNKVPTVIEENGYLKAKDSTLGADNGIGCAYMLALISQHKNCEFLFTSDEEIGLIGANNLTLEIKASNMLNLDSEKMGEIAIGCAGGIDIFGVLASSKIVPNYDNKVLYEITVENLPGGHSGVDIDKNIPNAIVLLFETIKQCNGDIIDINGGERINSIPKNAKAIIASNIVPQKLTSNINIVPIHTKCEHYRKIDQNLINFIVNFNNGVLEYDDELNVVIDSVNLSIIKTTADNVCIELSARSMDNYNLENITNKITKQLKYYNFQVTTNGKYPAWKPVVTEFTKTVLNIYQKYFENLTLYAIHAGLECAIFKEKFPSLELASIGPDILYPHSTREQCDIDSVYKVFEILEEIVDKS